MRQLPPLSALRAFEAAARRGNLSLAAQELNVTHGAVSKQVKTLERSLGFLLIKRTSKGVELTPEGRRLATHLTKAFDDLGAAVLSMESQVFEGTVTISCMPALASTWLIPRLAHFTAQYPNISLTILSPNCADPGSGITTDLDILYGRPDWPDRKVQLLKQLEIFPVCSPKIANGPNGVEKVSDLNNHVLIDNPESTHWRDFFVSHGMERNTAIRTLRFQDFSQCIAAARAGHGIAMGDNVTTAGDLATGALVRPLRENIRRQSLAYYLVTPQNLEATSSVRAFSEWLILEMQKGEST
jgi:LysR family transcriptional regulator, glycine cleavage system transcriptional activator